jgi:hypothetical protein
MWKLMDRDSVTETEVGIFRDPRVEKRDSGRDQESFQPRLSRYQWVEKWA